MHIIAFYCYPLNYNDIHRRWRPVYSRTYMAGLEGTGGCPCTNDKEHFKSRLSYRDHAVRGEFELRTARDVEWLLFSYT